MKKSLLLVCLLLGTSWLDATEKEIVKSSLTEVTVFAQGAQLHHKASYTLKPGVTEIILEGLSAFIDAKSIQVKATGNLVILDTKYSLFYPQPINVTPDAIPYKIKRDIEILEDSLRNLGYDLQEITDEINVLNASKSIISGNGAIRGQGKVNDSINLLKMAVEYYSVKMNEINKKLLALEKRKQDKLDRKSGMDVRLQVLRNYQQNNGFIQTVNNPIPRITVTVSCKETVTGKMSFSYLVSNAGWTPLYDLRSDAATGKLNLTYKAQVYQNTGLDWNEIKLNISTNNPFVNKTKPTLNPWYIDYNIYRTQEKEKLRLDNVKFIPQAAFNMGYNFEQKNSVDDMEALTADQFTTTVHHLISAEFKIDLPYTIKSNNEQHMVLVKTVDLDTKFKYFAVPKLDASVYLVAQMTKLDDLQLVPAKANIFFDGSYIGETFIDPTTMEDTLNLSLGKDPNIVIKRTLLKKELKDKIIGDKRERTFAYNIEVKSLKSSAIDLIIQDQFPITQNADITIEALEMGKGRFDKNTGLLEWSFNLKAKETRLIDYSYKVKHDKEKPLEIQ